MSRNEFYIGYLQQVPPKLGTFIRRVIVGLLAALVLLALGLAWSQRRLGDGVFEFGIEREFQGTILLDPYPSLRVDRPGTADEPQADFSRFQLVAPFKFGADEMLRPWSGRSVTLRGSLVFRDDQTMIEVVPDSLRSSPTQARSASRELKWGRATFEGAIVDSKCFLGVMNPGDLKPHRVCAAHCIRGGIPPVLVVRREGRPVLYLHLVDREDRPVNQAVLDLVAEPVRIEGEVIQRDDLLFLRAAPSSYVRLK